MRAANRRVPGAATAARHGVLLCCALVVLGATQTVDSIGTPRSRAALAQCNQAQAMGGAAAAQAFAAARAAAEVAVAADERDALAHFALFCALGGELRLGGVSLRSLFELKRLRAAVDRTLALAPEFPGAWAGKGALLLDTPRLLGGDPAEAERLLAEAVRLDPRYFRARLDLARALARRGATAEARAEGGRALAVADAAGDAADIAAAHAFLATLSP